MGVVRMTEEARFGMVFLVIAGVIALAVVGFLARGALERKRERRRHLEYMSVFHREPTDDPATCEHEWLEYTKGVCYSDSEGWGPRSEPFACETYTICMCPKCHATSLTCSGWYRYYRMLTGPDACMMCDNMPDCPAEVHAEQPKPST